jgi:signal transduction histidine kinase/DNA-binding NarL/FixJ family response regulator
MTGRKLIYYLLAGFIAGTLLLIFIQYNSAKNINSLINDNQQLIDAFNAGKTDSTRKQVLIETTNAIDKSGQKALRFSTILIVIVLVSAAALFWYIINTLRKQSRLIAELDASEKKVRETARVKENFLANMSHEIRTPMNAILGFTSLLQKQPLNDQSREYVQTIHQSGENLLTIINDVLDLSKIEAGMVRIEMAPFNIRHLLHSVEAMFIDKARDKGILFTIEVSNDVPEILEGDATRLTQILVNLVGNALKFTESGQITVQASGHLVITVQDTGIGIDAGKLETIFKRFEQAEDSVTRRYGGTGLGLAIVQELVTLQGGTIRAESQPGKGSVFTVTIPYNIATERIQHPAVSITPNLVQTHILVVEDNIINQSLIKHLFTGWGIAFDIANNGQEAIQMLSTNHYQLILMDIQMPGMDGYTATKHIREQLHLHTPIIAMTAHAMAGEREKCLHHGMNEYISKPLQEEELRKLIGRFAGKKTINLDYLRSVSAGNTVYEKDVTGQFLEAFPAELEALMQAWQKKDLDTLRHTAHSMKTTISVMGLNSLLESYLDILEQETLTGERFNSAYEPLQSIGATALVEARAFYASL